MKKLDYLYLALIVFIFSNCSKDKDIGGQPRGSGVWYIEQTIKDYSSFKPGTYWIYQDSITGAFDSVYVTDYNSGIDTIHDKGAVYGYFEYLDFYSVSSRDGLTSHYSVNTQWAKLWGTDPVWIDKFEPGNYIGATILMLFPYKIGQNYYPYTQDGIVTFVKLFDNLNIAGINFNKVMQFHDTENITEYKSATNHYIAKNIGIVRKEIIDSSQVWNLIRYNVVQ